MLLREVYVYVCARARVRNLGCHSPGAALFFVVSETGSLIGLNLTK